MEPRMTRTHGDTHMDFQYPQRIVNQWNLIVFAVLSGEWLLSVSSTDRQPMEPYWSRCFIAGIPAFSILNGSSTNGTSTWYNLHDRMVSFSILNGSSTNGTQTAFRPVDIAFAWAFSILNGSSTNGTLVENCDHSHPSHFQYPQRIVNQWNATR